MKSRGVSVSIGVLLLPLVAKRTSSRVPVSHLPSKTSGRRVISLAAIGAASVFLSCGRSVERSTVISFLEALQRPFDLHDVTVLGIPAELPTHLLLSALLAAVLAWLWRPRGACLLIGALIVVKEALDLAIITLYEPLTWTYVSDSVLDVVVSATGVGIGLLAAVLARRTQGPSDSEGPRGDTPV